MQFRRYLVGDNKDKSSSLEFGAGLNQSAYGECQSNHLSGWKSMAILNG